MFLAEAHSRADTTARVFLDDSAFAFSCLVWEFFPEGMLLQRDVCVASTRSNFSVAGCWHGGFQGFCVSNIQDKSASVGICGQPTTVWILVWRGNTYNLRLKTIFPNIAPQNCNFINICCRQIKELCQFLQSARAGVNPQPAECVCQDICCRRWDLPPAGCSKLQVMVQFSWLSAHHSFSRPPLLWPPGSGSKVNSKENPGERRRRVRAH